MEDSISVLVSASRAGLKFNVRPVFLGDGCWLLPEAPRLGSLMVFLNGLLMTPVDDYTLIENEVQFSFAQTAGWNPTAIVNCIYESGNI